jgi:hypothetical protein
MKSEELIEKIRDLTPEEIAEIEKIVDFFAQQHRLVQAATKLSEDSFSQVWDNEEDSVYDQL